MADKSVIGKSTEGMRDLPALMWVGLPVPLVVAAVALGILVRNWYPLRSTEWYEQKETYVRWFLGEHGIIEIATFVILALAAVVGIGAVRRAFAAQLSRVGVWLALVLLATIYFAGEEVSWGQSLFGWATPDWFQETTGNLQNETNIHNIDPWFNQKPRNLFTAWVIVGGIIVPWWAARRRRRRPEQTTEAYWFWPTRVCILTAVLAIFVWLPERIVKIVDLPPDHFVRWRLMGTNGSELQEYCFAVFLLLYFASFRVRLRQSTMRAAV